MRPAARVKPGRADPATTVTNRAETVTPAVGPGTVPGTEPGTVPGTPASGGRRGVGTLGRQCQSARLAAILGGMPIYEYRCENGHTFDTLQKFADDALDECEVCGAPARRVLHPVAIHFKGSGFYTTDYGRGKKEGVRGGGDSVVQERLLAPRATRVLERQRLLVLGDSGSKPSQGRRGLTVS